MPGWLPSHSKALRAVDPDPHGSAFIFYPGSGSISRRENFEEKNRKNAGKLAIIVSLQKKIK